VNPLGSGRHPQSPQNLKLDACQLFAELTEKEFLCAEETVLGNDGDSVLSHSLALKGLLQQLLFLLLYLFAVEKRLPLFHILFIQNYSFEVFI